MYGNNTKKLHQKNKKWFSLKIKCDFDRLIACKNTMFQLHAQKQNDDYNEIIYTKNVQWTY